MDLSKVQSKASTVITLAITRATLIISTKRCFLTPTVFLLWGGDDTGTKKSILAKAARGEREGAEGDSIV